MSKILNQSVSSLANAVQTGRISSEELTDLHLNRIKKINPELNAVVQITEEEALARARNADKALAKGEIAGPLHGIPMTIKDSFDTAGVISTGGTLGRKTFIPARNATIVNRLQEAGAILMGKTNTSEFTLTYDTDNLVYGRTKNPFDLSRIPGGSSGGAAAIVAAGGSPFDIGSDYGGSLRFPAHCCGLATIKPTSGRVPRTGHILPFGGLLDAFQQIGPLARSVDDLSLLLRIISGPDAIDPSIVPMPLGNPGAVDLKTLKISFHTDNGIIAAASDIDQMIRKAAALLEEDGFAVQETRPDGIEASHDLAMALWAADGGASIERLLKEAGTCEHTIPWLGLAPGIDSSALDALIMRWYGFRSTMLSFFNTFDLILCPVNAFKAPEIGSMGQDDLSAFSYTSVFNLTGWPAAVIRGGTTSDGLPVGLQIVAPPWREDTALAMAKYLETALGEFNCPGF